MSAAVRMAMVALDAWKATFKSLPVEQGFNPRITLELDSGLWAKRDRPVSLLVTVEGFTEADG